MNLRHQAVALTSVVLLSTAIGCGTSSETGAKPTTASDSSASASESSSPSADESTGSRGQLPVGDDVEPGQALIVSTSNVDGEVTPLATALVDERGIDDLVRDTDPRLAADVRAAVQDVEVPAGSTLFGSVVSVGCDEPVAVSYERTFDGIAATAQVPKSQVQCLVPVTSVALFLVPDTV